MDLNTTQIVKIDLITANYHIHKNRYVEGISISIYTAPYYIFQLNIHASFPGKQKEAC